MGGWIVRNLVILSSTLVISAGSVFAEDTSVFWGKIDGSLGSFQFEEDEIDSDDFAPMHAGFALSFGGQSAAGLSGSFDFLAENIMSEATDGDTTIQTLMAGGHLGWAMSDSLTVGGFAGAGQTMDNGDNDDGPVPFSFAGVEANYLANAATYYGQFGIVRSSDSWGETIQNAKFVRAGAWFAVAENMSLGFELSRVFGERWNDPVSNPDGTIDMRAGAILFEAQSKSLPLSYWASLDAYDYEMTDESDDPWVKELRIGVTYRFGSGASRQPASAGLPRINRWIATSANEIE